MCWVEPERRVLEDAQLKELSGGAPGELWLRASQGKLDATQVLRAEARTHPGENARKVQE
jgi:hypothetical protein